MEDTLELLTVDGTRVHVTIREAMQALGAHMDHGQGTSASRSEVLLLGRSVRVEVFDNDRPAGGWR